MLLREMLTFPELSPLLPTFEFRVLDNVLPACCLLARALRFWNQFLTFFSVIWPYWLSSTATSFTLCLLRVPVPCWNRFSRICSCCWLGVHFDLDVLLRVTELILRTTSYNLIYLPLKKYWTKVMKTFRLRLEPRRIRCSKRKNKQEITLCSSHRPWERTLQPFLSPRDVTLAKNSWPKSVDLLRVRSSIKMAFLSKL